MANLYLDEDVANLVQPLRAAGHTVVLAGELGSGRTDAWHLATASRQQRVLVTFNERDYKYLHRLWTSLRIFGLFSRKHGGIITATGQLDGGYWAQVVDDFLRSGRPTVERMWIYKPARALWQEDAWAPES